jgi:hypothetical protein
MAYLVFNILEVPKVEDVVVRNKENISGRIQDIGINDEERLLFQKIQINSNIKELDKSKILKKIIELKRRYESILSDSIIEVFIRSHYLGLQGQRLIYTRILILTPKERFDVTSEHQYIHPSFDTALFELDNQLLKKKISIASGPKRFPYNFNENITYKNFGFKIIKRKIRTGEATMGT